MADPQDPKDPETADDWAAMAERFDAKVRFHSAQLATFAALRDRARAIAESMRSGGRLTIDHISATTEPPMQPESAGAGRSAGRIDPEHADHKFVAMLLRRKITIGDIKAHLEAKLKRDFPSQTIQAWYRSDDYFRAPPDDAVLVLKEDFAVPVSAWRRIRKYKPKRA